MTATRASSNGSSGLLKTLMAVLISLVVPTFVWGTDNASPPTSARAVTKKEALLAGSTPPGSTPAEWRSRELLPIEEITFRPSANEEQVPAQFRLAPHTFQAKAKIVREISGVNVYRVKFPSPVVTGVPQNNTVHAVYFQPAGPGPFPACVVLHILGGDFLLSESIANYLAHNGVAAMFVKMPYYGERRGGQPRRMVSKNPEETVEGMTQGVLDIRQAAAWLAQRPEVDPERLGITGISLGGIMSALGGAAEPRFKNVAIYLGGGNFADFIWDNPIPDAQKFRDFWTAKGGTRETFKQTLLPIDPVTHGALLKDRRVLMVVGKFDEVITPSSAKALHEVIGPKARIVWLEAGHYTAARYLPQELLRLEAFFKGPPRGSIARSHNADGPSGD